MTEILAVFRARTQAADLHNKLSAMRIPCALVPTPKEAGIGCGLSVKFPLAYAARVKAYTARMNYSAFYGYLTVQTRSGGNAFGK